MAWKIRRMKRRKKKPASNQVSPLHEPLAKGIGDQSVDFAKPAKPKRSRKKTSGENAPVAEDDHGR